MLDESKAIKAGDIVKNPDAIYQLNEPYILLIDQSVNVTFSNFIQAVNLLTLEGWEIGNLCAVSGTHMFVLCRNPRYKAKRRPEDN